ncbi:MAG: hypothetical protein JST22_21185 [Bacteroidetes bacterium]|nr:hypothetical protein [Bacteroidota bacterium]
MEGMIVGVPWLDWALVALSIINILLPVWLGLTILLNAEHRRFGIWLAGFGMLAAACFFLFHAVMLHGEFLALPARLREWWFVGWAPIIGLPYGWAVAMFWFADFWRGRPGRGRTVRIAALLALGLLALAVAFIVVSAGLARGADAGGRGAYAEFDILLRTGELPYVYALYILACIGVALECVLSISATSGTIADIARRRARPWLLATTLLQFGVALLAIGSMFWLYRAVEGQIAITSLRLPLAWLDLAACGSIAVAFVLIGNAVVSYEIFTGKTLPRQGLRRHWRNALLLAAVFGVGTGAAIELGIPRYWTLLGTTILAAAFYALLNWRSYIGRERYLANLRPFVGSGRLYEHMVNVFGAHREDRDEGDASVAVPFRALCREVLGARQAYLAPLGALAPLAGKPLAWPEGGSMNPELMPRLAAVLDRSQALSVPLTPAEFDGCVWAIPLRSDRGLVGALLLGEKLDDGLYTQEEMEIARSSGERMVDMMAGTEMARRLVLLQRQRMAESQVADARTRRVLHDDVLPRIHATMLAISASGAGSEARAEAIATMTDLHRGISGLLRDLPMPAAATVAKLGVLGTLRQILSGEMRTAFEEVVWNVEPGAEQAAMHLAPATAEVFFYAAREVLRNADRHARRTDGTPLRVTITARGGDGFELAIEDNGDGSVRNTRTANGGSGRGLALHGTMMAVVGGSLAVERTAAGSMRATLAAP